MQKIDLNDDNFDDIMQKELSFIVKPIVQYFKSHDQQFLKSIDMHHVTWRKSNDEPWFIIGYGWNSRVDYDESKFERFTAGLNKIISTLRTKGWKVKKHGLVKKYNKTIVDIEFYTGDNDGNVIGPVRR